jgi:hypothetical protein
MAGASIAIDVPLSGGQGNSNTFGTADAVCVIIEGSVVSGWSIVNPDSRRVIIVGATTLGPLSTWVDQTGGAIPAGPDGRVYFNFSAGADGYTELLVY